MSGETISPNMNLPIPGVSITDGPQWAEDLNSSLTLVDSHDHSSGKGVPITPAGLSITSDLPMNSHTLTLTKSVSFAAQSVPISGSSLDCLYVSGVDLYYNDGSGNQIQITQSGGIAGSPGSISNLTSPASAAYVSGSQTFVWQSDVSTSANLDAASVILRNLTASSKGLTLSPPNAMGSDYSLILPSLPASTKFMSLDASGNMGASWAVDNSTLEVSSNTVQVKDSGIVTAKIASGAVTKVKLGALGQQISSSSGTYSTTSATYVSVTNLSVSLTTYGRPVFLLLIPSGAGDAYLGMSGGNFGYVGFVRNVSALSAAVFEVTAVAPGAFSMIDVVGAGTYTYSVQVKSPSSVQLSVINVCLLAYEM